jgi:hypothetical protein
MSIKTFFDKIWDFLKAEAPSAQNWEQAASTALKVASPLLDTLLTLTAGEAVESKVAGIVAQVQQDMSGAAGLLSGAGGTKATLTSFLTSIQTNLGTLLTDADVKNATKFTEIESTANTIIGEIEAVASSMPSDYTPPAPPAAPVSAAAASDAPHAPATASLTTSK